MDDLSLLFFASFAFENKLKKFLVVSLATSSVSIFLIFAICSNVYFVNAGSFLFPLLGMGARYGESVSTRILFKGTYLTIFLISSALSKVITPENDM